SKYHIGFVPKYRRRVLDEQRRRSIGRSIRALCQQQGGALMEGHAMPEHVPRCLRMPPKFSGAHTGGWLKGQAAIRIHRECLGRERKCTGWHCWARGAGVSTVGLAEQVIREYSRH